MLREDISTIQEAFDYVTEKLVLQGKRCMVSFDGTQLVTCSYGDGNGGNCGIGKLLDPNDATLMLFEGDVEEMYNDHPDRVPKVVSQKNLPFLMKLQSFHDLESKTTRHHVLYTIMYEHNIILNNGNAIAWVNLGTGETIYE